MKEVFVDYEEEDNFGVKKRVKGKFKLIKKTDNFIEIQSERNLIRVNMKDVHKLKENIREDTKF